MSRLINRFLDQQRWLDPLGEAFQKAIGGIYKSLGGPGRGLKTLLHGTWLGHPLHPVITDIPLGAWTLAIVFDLLWLIKGTHGWVSAADVTIAIGLLGAVGAAVTGYTDWNETYARERRVGLAHGLLNTAALVLYLVSMIVRLSGHGRLLAIIVALVGYAFVTSAAFLGGELVFNIGTGVNHHAFQHQPDKFMPVLAEAQLVDGTLVKGMAGETPVLLYKTAGRICAIGETCSHAGGPLSEGKLDGNDVICPWHASRFDVSTGAVKSGPATISQVRYETRLQNGQIEVRVSPQTAQHS